jgi:hypothetical protein
MAYVVARGNLRPTANTGGPRIYTTPTYARPNTASASRQAQSNRLWGGNPGIGSMQPGRVVSHQTKPSAARQQNQQALNSLMQAMQASQQQANQAGLQRYQDLLATIADLQSQVTGEGGTYQSALELIQGTGQSARRRVGEQKVKNLAAAEQDLISRGLGNTTVRSSVQRGIKRDAERSMERIDEQTAQRLSGLLERRAGLETQLGRLKADAILSRSDEGPQLNQYTNLLMALASQG